MPQAAVAGARLGLSLYPVLEYGAVGDGNADDTNACLRAIAAAVAGGGGDVVFAPGTYKISSTLTLGNGSTSANSTQAPVRLRSAVPWWNDLSTGTPGAGNPVTLKWFGAAGGIMVTVQGPCYGWGIEGIDFDANATANTCVNLASAMAGDMRRCGFKINGSVLTQGAFGLLLFSLGPATGGFTGHRNVMHNRFESLIFTLNPTGAAASFGYAIYMDGQDVNADPAYNTWIDTTIIFNGSTGKQTGIHFGGCEQTRFIDTHMTNFGVAPAGSTLVDFTFNNGVATNYPSDCIMDDVDFGTSLAGIATSGVPSGNPRNAIYNIHKDNGIPANPAFAWLSWGAPSDQSSGTATIAATGTSVVVNHNLPTAPTSIQVEATSDPGLAIATYVDTITATQFTLHARPAVTNQTTFQWWAKL